MRIAFTHDTKPNMKKSNPIIKMEITVSLLVNELTSTAAVSDLLIGHIYSGFVAASVSFETSAADALSRKIIQFEWD
jgi:hypothetical protein